MTPSDFATVYYFRHYGSDNGAGTVSSFKATRETITEVWQGQVLEGTAETVSVDQLDSQRRYQRIATGWGELDEIIDMPTGQDAERQDAPHDMSHA